eukprot:COSAG06_NODE_34382_length_475_cov_1.231383_2_plen_66_part_01
MKNSHLGAAVATGLIVRREARPAAMLDIRESDLPWLEAMRRQDQTAQHTAYRNVTRGLGSGRRGSG